MFLITDARVSSASQQRHQVTGVLSQGVTSRPTRHRKMSRSAGPSLAALRKTLKISGGEYKLPVLLLSGVDRTMGL